MARDVADALGSGGVTRRARAAGAGEGGATAGWGSRGDTVGCAGSASDRVDCHSRKRASNSTPAPADITRIEGRDMRGAYLSPERATAAPPSKTWLPPHALRVTRSS